MKYIIILVLLLLSCESKNVIIEKYKVANMNIVLKRKYPLSGTNIYMDTTYNVFLVSNKDAIKYQTDKISYSNLNIGDSIKIVVRE